MSSGKWTFIGFKSVGRSFEFKQVHLHIHFVFPGIFLFLCIRLLWKCFSVQLISYFNLRVNKTWFLDVAAFSSSRIWRSYMKEGNQSQLLGCQRNKRKINKPAGQPLRKLLCQRDWYLNIQFKSFRELLNFKPNKKQIIMRASVWSVSSFSMKLDFISSSNGWMYGN